jgi:pimeloyl-ACP methyl ester carboxylesterase
MVMQNPHHRNLQPALSESGLPALVCLIADDESARTKTSTNGNTNMKMNNNIEITSRVNGRKNRTVRAVLASVGFLLAAATPTIAASGAAVASEQDPNAIRPFHVSVPDEQLADLRQRIAATRWPDKETVNDQSQGVQLATIQELARYWRTDYDWRKAEARLNALPQFVTTIDGVDIYFIHVRSPHTNALPVIITHGWPGSVFELLNLIGPLTDPTAYGGRAEDAFDVVIPSMPGYGFSGKPTTPGWNSDHIARAWDTLMKRLGYTHYVAQGGDWGARVSESLARQAPPGLLGIHMNLLVTIPPEIARAAAAGDPAPAGLSEKERSAFEQRKRRTLGYFIEQATRPQTIGFSLADSPVGLAAWMLDHDPHSYQQMAHAFEGHPEGGLTRDAILDNITLYWLTDTGASAARLYWEEARISFKGDVTVPAAFTVFPGETVRAPRSWVERTFPNLIYFHEVDKGGHFAAWEQPELMASEMRAAFKSLRDGGPTALNR